MAGPASTSVLPATTTPPRPLFNLLPLNKSGPRGNAWGLYGPDDEIGALNLLTPVVVREAAKEIREGVRLCVDLPLNFLEKPFFERAVFSHAILNKAPRVVNDDLVHINTQSATQWDGLRHYGYQNEKVYYNGTTPDQIQSTNKIGIHNMVNVGGIVGRGVLLDWDRWAHTQPDLDPDRCSTHSIPLSNLLAVAAHQGTTFKAGDILFIRTGWTRNWNSLSKAEKASIAALGKTPGAIGIKSCEEILRWIWETGFCAVAGDQPAFEAHPFQSMEWHLHQWCLSGWGMPIGELFYLEELAKECERLGRWSFWFSSAPLHVPGGVASPSNGVAVL